MVATTLRPGAVLTLWVWMAYCNAPCWCTDDSNVSILLVAPPKPINVSSSSSLSTSTAGALPPTSAEVVLPVMSSASLPVSSPLPPAPYSSLNSNASSGPWSCLAQMECDAIGDLELPPELLLPFLPPPPMPAFLLGAIDLPRPPPTPPSEGMGSAPEADETCNLCEWAVGENETAEVTATTTVAPATTLGVSEETTWISILVVASLASATVGAIFMIILIKCRKLKILPMADSCPILPESYFGSKSSKSATCRGERRDDDENSSITTPSMDQSADKAEQKSRAPGGGGGWSFWRRSSASTERPLRSSSSMCSEENSYSEEPYIVSEHSSALYAELNSVCQDGNGPYRTYSMNTYSEVSDPGSGKGGGTTDGTVACPRTHRRLISDGTYENAAYVVSENGTDCGPATPTQAETDSVDTPSSSAYYSDSSNQTNGRKRKKKQQRPADDTRGHCRSETVALDSLPPDFPVDYRGHCLVHYVHEQYCDQNGVEPLESGAAHGTGKRPLPPAPPAAVQQSPPAGLRSSMRPLPPVPSQYV